MWRKSREAAQAMLRAKAADDRAEDALATAKQALEAVAGLREIEAERDRQKVLEDEAPALIQSWISAARQNAPRRTADLRRTPWLHHRVELKTERELVAARLAAKHDEVRQVDPPRPVLGRHVSIFIDNPFKRGPR